MAHVAHEVGTFELYLIYMSILGMKELNSSQAAVSSVLHSKQMSDLPFVIV